LGILVGHSCYTFLMGICYVYAVFNIFHLSQNNEKTTDI
jgi:hypothetical protein